MKTTVLFLAAALGLLGVSSASAASLTVAVNGPGPFKVGDTVTFDVMTADGFPDFSGFQLFGSFDPAALQFVSGAALDPGVAPAFFFQLAAPSPVAGSPGSLSALQAGVLGGVIGDGALIAQFSFSALSPGVTSFDLTTDFQLAVPGQGGQVVFDSPASGSVNIMSDGVTTPIPLPPAAFLMLAGLSALRLAGSRRRAI